MYNIAFFLGELQLDSQRKVLEGIVKSAKADGNNVIVYCLTLSTDEEFNIGESSAMLFDDFSVYDGFIIYAESIYSATIRTKVITKIMEQHKPAASIDCPIPGMINISSDNEMAMQTLSKHLINEHGIKTVNFVSGPEDSLDSVTRKRVFEMEMSKKGLKLEKDRCYTGDYYARSGRAAVAYFESKGLLEADAYVCANDQMALGVFYALTDRGIKIPDDTILSGYDNIFEAANHYPRITTVNRFEEKIGETAYRNVIHAIEGKEYDKNPVIDSQPVYAESCGCSAVRPLNHRIVVNHYSRSKLREARYAEMISELTVELTNAETPEDICSALRPRLAQLGCDAFCLMISDDEDPSIETGVNVVAGINYFGGKFGVISKEYIREHHPRFDANVGGHLYVIDSIHYREKFYGIAIIRDSNMPFFSEFYRVLIMTLSSALERVRNVQMMKKMIKTLDEMWVFDPMTHVYNRAGFFKFSEEIMQNARRGQEDMFFIFLDLDGLKKVNDEFGHEMGDRMICDMADVLRKLRNREELLMRYGGDEFVVFGKGLSSAEVEEDIARIRKAMEELNNSGDRIYRLDASIGYHIVPYDNEKPLSALIEMADQEMYKEKREKHKR